MIEPFKVTLACEGRLRPPHDAHPLGKSELKAVVLGALRSARVPLTVPQIEARIGAVASEGPRPADLRRALRSLRTSGQIIWMGPLRAYVAVFPRPRKSGVLLCSEVHETATPDLTTAPVCWRTPASRTSRVDVLGS